MTDRLRATGSQESQTDKVQGAAFNASSTAAQSTTTSLFVDIKLPRLEPPDLATMGLLSDLVARLCEHCSSMSLWALVGGGFASFLILTVVLNVLKQLLLKNPNEPPVVFHLFPVIGSTVTYGIDPYKFFFDCREKVRIVRVDKKSF